MNLPAALREEARELRNKLLLFRFRNLTKPRDLAIAADRALEPRLAQILSPLMATIEDEEARGRLRDLARGYERQLVADRGMETEGQLLEVIRDLAAAETPLSVKEITALFADRHENDYDRKISAKWIGYLLRRKLGLHPEKRHGGIFVIPDSDKAMLTRLFEKYGVPTGDIGDVEDIERPSADA